MPFPCPSIYTLSCLSILVNLSTLRISPLSLLASLCVFNDKYYFGKKKAYEENNKKGLSFQPRLVGQFHSCFIGSLLGIGITFAVSGYLEYKNKKELEHTIQLMNVADMYLTVDSFKSEEESALYLDSLFKEISFGF